MPIDVLPRVTPRSLLGAVLVLALVGCRPTPVTPPGRADYEAILGLMRQRLQVMQDVARWKWNAKKPIADPEREQAFLREMVEQGGRDHGLAPDAVRTFFTAQIEAGKLMQEAAFTQWRQEGRGDFAGVPPLATELRPRIDRVSRDLLAALARVPSSRPDVDQVRTLARTVLTGDGITDEVRDRALAPLVAPEPTRRGVP